MGGGDRKGQEQRSFRVRFDSSFSLSLIPYRITQRAAKVKRRAEAASGKFRWRRHHWRRPQGHDEKLLKATRGPSGPDQQREVSGASSAALEVISGSMGNVDTTTQASTLAEEQSLQTKWVESINARTHGVACQFVTFGRDPKPFLQPFRVASGIRLTPAAALDSTRGIAG